MSSQTVFLTHLVLGYVPWLLFLGAYIWPRLNAMDHFDAQRAIAAVHSFRVIGLAFLLPGVVGSSLPAGFATFAAYGNLATGVLAMLALLAIRIRPLFWLLVLAFNLVGVVDIALDSYHAVQVNLPAVAGELGGMYAFLIIYMPLQMISHLIAFYLLARSQMDAVSSGVGDAAGS
ncbi:hypothetical protein FJW08_04285 [Mesorhizobium sp. B3-2-1]|uniref:hypothetical protein n=1 Tax=Mesorhizobium sp. B3-2-1 TaxID=2589891 RepID=UPI001128D116|nr:hypothetical protein [Mesorhizobium sp. B3-2-1]TPI33947.1 hypothetical protein FJW08_04285 [Mesorhizobium sp. B3-2-1]